MYETENFDLVDLAPIQFLATLSNSEVNLAKGTFCLEITDSEFIDMKPSCYGGTIGTRVS